MWIFGYITLFIITIQVPSCFSLSLLPSDIDGLSGRCKQTSWSDSDATNVDADVSSTVDCYSRHIQGAKKSIFDGIGRGKVPKRMKRKNAEMCLRDLLAENTIFILPTKEEMESFYSFKTITMSSKNFSLGISNGSSLSEAFAGDKRSSNWVLPRRHPLNQNRSFLLQQTKLSEDVPITPYADKKNAWEASFIINMKARGIFSAIYLSREGVVATDECPYTWFQQRNGCAMTVMAHGRSFVNNINNINKNKNTTFVNSFPRYNRVFSISSEWDYNWYHFLADSASRLIRFRSFLQRNPDIYIHIGNRSDDSNTTAKSGNRVASMRNLAIQMKHNQHGISIRNTVIQYLGLHPSRMISGNIVVEKELFLPSAPICCMLYASPFESRLMASEMKKRARINNNKKVSGVYSTRMAPSLQSEKRGASETSDTSESGGVVSEKKLDISHGRKRKAYPLIVYQHRQCPQYGNVTFIDHLGQMGDFCDSWRYHTNYQANEIVSVIQEAFPRHIVHKVNDTEAATVQSLDSMIELYGRTQILVGLHGAGLTNTMFMSPGSILIEICGEFDGRMLPLSGYYDAYSSLFGVHHYIYYWDSKTDPVLNAHSLVQEMKLFIERIAKL